MITPLDGRRPRHGRRSGTTTSTTRCTRWSPASGRATTSTSARWPRWPRSAPRPSCTTARYSTFRGHMHGRPVDRHLLPGYRFVVLAAEPRPDRQPGRRRPARRAGHRRRCSASRPSCCSPRRSPRCCSWARSGPPRPAGRTSPSTPSRSWPTSARAGARSSPTHGWDTAQMIDPQDPRAFHDAVLDWDELAEPEPHASMLALVPRADRAAPRRARPGRPAARPGRRRLRRGRPLAGDPAGRAAGRDQPGRRRPDGRSRARPRCCWPPGRRPLGADRGRPRSADRGRPANVLKLVGRADRTIGQQPQQFVVDRHRVVFAGLVDAGKHHHHRSRLAVADRVGDAQLGPLTARRAEHAMGCLARFAKAGSASLRISHVIVNTRLPPVPHEVDQRWR